MSTLERYLIFAVIALIGTGAFAGWWALHNRHEQNLGAVACLQATTIPKQAALEEVKADSAAQASQINAVVQTYDKQVSDLSASNDDLSGRLSAALRQSRLPNPRPPACPGAAEPGLPQGEAETEKRLGRLRADINAVLEACDANQVKTEAAATIYEGVRARAMAAAKLN